ncbi:hypothetical protein SUDANB70_00449 [Streptomyces sp. enrichment culture]
MSLDPTGKDQARWTMPWKTALHAFDITFDGRLSAARQSPQPPWLHRSFQTPVRPRKIWRELNRQGHEVARCTVERLMRETGITGAVHPVFISLGDVRRFHWISGK